MGVIGARPGDFVRCLKFGEKEACRRIYVGYWLWPHIQKLLEDLEVLPRIPVPWPPEPPRPDPPPDRLEELIPVLLGQGEHAFSAKFKLETTRQFRDGLAGVIKELDGEIESLQAKS